MKTKLSLAIAAASLLATSAFAGYAQQQQAPATKNNLYISVTGGANIANHDDNGYITDTNKLNAGYNLGAAVGYTFMNSEKSDVRVELQYLRTHNGYSKNLKNWVQKQVNDFAGGTAADAQNGNYVMVNALFDWKFNPQFSANVGIAAGYAHLNAMINNANQNALSSNGKEVLNAENTWATGLIFGGQWNLSPQFSVGASYEALLTSSARAGKYVSFTDYSVTVSNAMLINNLFNLSLAYHLPM